MRAEVRGTVATLFLRLHPRLACLLVDGYLDDRALTAFNVELDRSDGLTYLPSARLALDHFIARFSRSTATHSIWFTRCLVQPR